MFDGIADDNEVIAAENEARREQTARCKPSKPGRPTGAERKLLAAERAKLAEMKPFRNITGPASRQAIRRTLRAALNSAIAQQLITFNPAAHVELESGKRPKPLLWTDERVRRWRETGEIPGPVMVWTPQQFGAFLDAAEGDRLYAIFHLMGTRGLRRGEAVGQDWHEIDRPAAHHPAGPAPCCRDAHARGRRRHPCGEGDAAPLHHRADLGHVHKPAP